MRRLTTGRLAAVAILSFVSAFLAPVAPAARAQTELPKPEKVKFDTFDKVELHGTFFPSNKGAQVPCVMMIHPTGANRKVAGFEELAKKLQEDFAVLTFDLRGHGDSTGIDNATFWNIRENQQLRGASPSKTTISFTDFGSTYWPMLVNDLTAAKRFLDRQNDASRCISSNTIVVGVGDGTALGAYFIASEWKRHIPISTQPFLPVAQQPLAGPDISCAVLLSMTSAVNKSARLPIETWFGSLQPPIREKVPMYFIYGSEDKSATLSAKLEKLITYKNPKAKLSGSRAIKEAKALSGKDLLKTSLPTVGLVSKYLEKVIDDIGVNAPQKKDVEKTQLYQVPYEQIINWR
jgi:predicted esterase